MTMRLFTLAVLLATITACSYPTRNKPATDTTWTQPYSWAFRERQAPDDTLIVVTASGGGTRAAALSAAVLNTMHKVELPTGGTLANRIDVISSVSGGSVTAAYFALHGPDKLPVLERDFLRQDGMGAIMWHGLNPVGLAALSTPSVERIDVLIDYLDRQLFKEKTYADLIQRNRPPHLILNAADMVEGVHFPFTQYTMDLLCSDLAKMKLSTAVSASAAFPVALSPVTLTNYSGPDCRLPPNAASTAWINGALRTKWEDNPSRLATARVADAYRTGRKKYVHLLDGGIADNLGVNELYRYFTAFDVVRLGNEIEAGRIRKIVFVMINARSFSSSKLDQERATPGILPMLLASLNSSIDRATFSTAERFRTHLAGFADAAAAAAEEDKQSRLAQAYRDVADHSHYVGIDFDSITDGNCRRRFHSLATSWTLSAQQITALMAMGEALLNENAAFGNAQKTLGSRFVSDRPLQTVTSACTLLTDADV